MAPIHPTVRRPSSVIYHGHPCGSDSLRCIFGPMLVAHMEHAATQDLCEKSAIPGPIGYPARSMTAATTGRASPPQAVCAS
eukprot:14589894-Alexandrium_andersonii.AAC.1